MQPFPLSCLTQQEKQTALLLVLKELLSPMVRLIQQNENGRI